MTELKLTQIGSSLGVILPEELLTRLRLAEGDTVFVSETPDGVQLTPHSADRDAQRTAAREIMERRRAVLRALAE